MERTCEIMDRDQRKDSIAALHRDNIVTAADELFTEKGFDRTTMDDIAARAQYSKRTIYTYFDSKDEIYSYFVAKGIRALIAEFERAISFSDNFIEQYQELCSALAEFRRNQFPYYEGVMMFFNQPQSAEPIGATAEIYAFNEKLNRLLERLFKQAQDAGFVLQNVDIKRLVLIVWSNLTSLIEMVHTKEHYINTTLHATSEEFMSFGFKLVLNAVLDAG